jgi:hypothetical protein
MNFGWIFDAKISKIHPLEGAPILASKIHPKFMCLLRHLPGLHFSYFVRKSAIFGPSSGPHGPQMAPQIAQVAPKCRPNLNHTLSFLRPSNRRCPRGRPYRPQLIFDDFCWFRGPPNRWFSMRFAISFASQDINLNIATRKKPTPANKRSPRIGTSQNGGRRCHAAWRLQ